MIVYKVSVKSMFYVEAENIPEAKRITDKAIGSLPHAKYNIKATKMSFADFQNDGERD